MISVLLVYSVMLYVMQSSFVKRKACDKFSDISELGHRLCHYSATNGKFNEDLSGNGNDLDWNEVDMVGIRGHNYGGYAPDGSIHNEWFYDNHISSGNGYIIFPEQCNLPNDGYTLFTATMYYGPANINNRAFGNCDDNSFVSGFYQPESISGLSNILPNMMESRTVYGIRKFTTSGLVSHVLAKSEYDMNGWLIISDTMNSFRMNGAEITNQIPFSDSIGTDDVQICFNYINGVSTNGYYRIREYIVFEDELNNADKRCVEEYIYDKYNKWDNLSGLAPENNFYDE